MKKIVAALAVAAIGVSLAPAADAGKAKTVWEDADGDADLGQGLGGSLPGGWDLVSGSITKNKDVLEFTVTHADMPPVGSGPEATRFLWTFMVDDTEYRLTVKSVDIGKPDVSQGQTTERVGRVDAQGHFRLEGDCGVTNMGIDFINCKPLEYLEGKFDAAAMSFTVYVPLKSIGAEVGSVITQSGGTGSQICPICWVSHYAERSLSPQTVIDSTSMTATYKVPKK